MAAPVTQSSEARERVIEAAYVLFVERGFADVSMQQIADGASITKATLYHHFRDKQDLYLAVMRKAFTENTARFFERLGDKPELRVLIREVLLYIIVGKQADIQRLISDFRQHINEDTQREFWVEFPKPWVSLEPAVQAEIDSGNITTGDPAFLAKYIYGAVAGFAHVSRMSQKPEEVDDDFLNLFTDTVMNGVTRK